MLPAFAGAQSGVFSLKKCTPIPDATQMLGSAVVGNRLYVFGGGADKAGWSNNVYSAEISGQGDLGMWRMETPMPERRAYIGNSVEVVNNRIYIVGGTIADTSATKEKDTRAANDALFTSVRSDGTLDAWKHSAPFPDVARSNLATCSSDQNLFILGGTSKNVVHDSVLAAEFAPDGTPTNWRQVAKLPTPLWFHGAAVMDNQMYVWGGLPTPQNANLNDKVYTASVSPNGTLGPWQTESIPMTPAMYSSSFCGINDYLVAIAGRFTNGSLTNTILFSRVVNKRPQQWQALQTDLDTRVYQAVGLDKARGWVFVVGGRYKTDTEKVGRLLNTVQAFSIPQPAEAKITTVQATPGAAAPSASSGGVVALPKLADAAATAKAGGKQVLAFFYSPQVPACRRAWDTVLSSAEFKQLSSSYVLAGVDVTSPDSRYSYQFNIFKVPALAVMTPEGALVKKTIQVLSVDDVKKLLGSN
ncbi:MAG: thioredoxin family protein [Candidatus Sumerlaeaceae bacterium]|nr:thioredoxin family protein [Candidatus Sumerlaeaceae bacterium]